MADHTKMSIQAIFDSFDTNIKNGEIDKKEAKSAKKLYGGIFIIKEGMNINAFKDKNKSIWEDKNIHSTILNKANENRQLYNQYHFDDNRCFFTNSAAYFPNEGIY